MYFDTGLRGTRLLSTSCASDCLPGCDTSHPLRFCSVVHSLPIRKNSSRNFCKQNFVLSSYVQSILVSTQKKSLHNVGTNISRYHPDSHPFQVSSQSA